LIQKLAADSAADASNDDPFILPIQKLAADSAADASNDDPFILPIIFHIFL